MEKPLLTDNDYLMEMSEVRGKDCKTAEIDFSFCFSSKKRLPGQIRCGVRWNREKMAGGIDGFFELFGEYKYKQSLLFTGEIDSNRITLAKNFFKKYKIIFTAVWEEAVDAPDAEAYFKGEITLQDLIGLSFLKKNDIKKILETIRKETSPDYQLKSFEVAVRKQSLFNICE